MFTLRNLTDADRLLAATATSQRVAILGGGFIGLEMAENYVHRHQQVLLIELGTQIMPPLDREITQPIEQELRDRGVELHLGKSIATISANGSRLSLELTSGESTEVDSLLVSVGVRPENRLAQDAGLEIGDRGGIRVNAQMQTSDPDIYAVGDAIETTDALTGAPTQVPLAGPANRQGRLAANHIFGQPSAYRGTQGTAIVGLFGKAAAITGLSEKAAQRSGIPYKAITIHPAHHAGYYPGAETMALKLLFSPEDGKILGGQAVGGAGVDKRIDGLAIAIQAGLTVYDLEEAELCYAPQFGSAKDPLNMLGFVARGSCGAIIRLSGPDQLDQPEWSSAVRLDVRTPAEYAAGHLPEAINLPIDELRERLDEVPRDRPVVTYCTVGMRGYLATRILRQHGIDATNLTGGYTSWQQFHG